MTSFPTTRRAASQVLTLDDKRYFLATQQQAKSLSVKRAWDTASESRQGAAQIGQPFEIPLADFHEGYGFTFAPGGRPVYDIADGWDVSAPGKATTWPRLATCESVTDTNYRGWLYFDYTSGYLYMFRGKYATKYHPDDTVNGTWSILEFHEFGAGFAVAGKPAVFNGKVYVPLIKLSDGTIEPFHELTTIAAPVTSVQTATISGTPTGGSYTLTYNDGVTSATTAAIAYNASGAAVQAALRLLPGLQKITVATTGSTPNFTHTITLTAAQTVQATAVPFVITRVDNTTGGTHAVTMGTVTAGSGDTWHTGPSSPQVFSYFTVWNKPTVGPVLVGANANTVSTCAGTPLTGGNWSTAQTAGDSTFNITALATLGRFLMVARPDGLYSFDESGTVVNEIPAISAVTDSQNGVGMVEGAGWLYMPHKLGTIRWRMGSPWSIIGAEEDEHLEGELTMGGWGRTAGIAPYGKYTYVTVNDPYDTQSTIASWQPPSQGRSPVVPHMHHRTSSVLEDAAIAVLKSQPVATHDFSTFSDDNAVGTVAWTNPSNASQDDGQQATATTAGITHYLKALNPLYAIPTSSTINGIQLSVKRLALQPSVTVGPTSPGTGANFAGVGTNAWTNPGNITSSDNAYATNATTGQTQGLRASAFGFAIPASATILGITAEIERKQSASGTNVTTSATFAGTGASSAFGGNAWANPSRVTADDGSYSTATFTGPGVGNTDYLVATNYGFAIPTDAVILGIKVEYKRYMGTTSSSYVTDNGAQLTKNGTAVVGSNYATVTAFPSGVGAVAYQTYGGASDLWGTTWTPSEVNASTFGFRFYGNYNANADTVTANVDAVRITVTYQTANGLDVVVSLVNDSSATFGSNYAATTTSWPTSDAYATYGGAADLWGATITPTIVNSANFGVLLSASVPLDGRTLSVDHMRITVTYVAHDVVDTTVRLVKAGSVVGSNYAATTTQWPTVAQTTTYGSATDLWGTSWTPADVNGTTFGAVLSATVVAGTAAVEYVSILVFFTIQGIADPSSYLAVITLDPNSSNATATPIVYKLPRSGMTVSNDPNIDKAVSLGADFRTSRYFDPSRAVLKQWQEYECYLSILPEGGSPSGTLTPGVQVEAQIDDNGTWIVLADPDGQSTFYTSGSYELLFPVSQAIGHWVQIRVVIAAASASQVGVSCTMRDGVLRGFLITKNTDQITAVCVLREGGQFEDGYIEKRNIKAQLDDLNDLLERDPKLGPIPYQDPTSGEQGWMVLQGQGAITLQEKQFVPGQASQWVATIHGRKVPYQR